MWVRTSTTSFVRSPSLAIPTGRVTALPAPGILCRASPPLPAQRGWRLVHITPRVVAEVKALACELPAKLGLAPSRFSRSELRCHMLEAGIAREAPCQRGGPRTGPRRHSPGGASPLGRCALRLLLGPIALRLLALRRALPVGRFSSLGARQGPPRTASASPVSVLARDYPRTASRPLRLVRPQPPQVQRARQECLRSGPDVAPRPAPDPARPALAGPDHGPPHGPGT